MKEKYSVMVISHNNLQGEVYGFDSFREAQQYAKARKELIDMLYPKGTLNSLFRPRVVISSLNSMKKKKRSQRCNDFFEHMTSVIRKKLETNYMPRIEKRMTKQDMDIVKCYEKTGLANYLYGSLNEEDDERFRESIQNLADNIMNEEIMPTLCNIGYVF